MPRGKRGPGKRTAPASGGGGAGRSCHAQAPRGRREGSDGRTGPVVREALSRGMAHPDGYTFVSRLSAQEVRPGRPVAWRPVLLKYHSFLKHNPFRSSLPLTSRPAPGPNRTIPTAWGSRSPTDLRRGQRQGKEQGGGYHNSVLAWCLSGMVCSCRIPRPAARAARLLRFT